jgi:hypothetical protein
VAKRFGLLTTSKLAERINEKLNKP